MCAGTADDKFECSSAGGVFMISGKDRRVSLTSPVTDYKPGGGSNNSSDASSSISTKNLAASATQCGTMNTGDKVEIRSGGH